MLRIVTEGSLGMRTTIHDPSTNTINQKHKTHTNTYTTNMSYYNDYEITNTYRRPNYSCRDVYNTGRAVGAVQGFGIGHTAGELSGFSSGFGAGARAQHKKDSDDNFIGWLVMMFFIFLMWYTGALGE